MKEDAPAAHVRVDRVSRHFGAGESLVEVLHDVSFSVAPGARCVIVGASGSGKSTLLNAIGGLDRPDAGTIQVAGQEVTAMSPRELARYRRGRLACDASVARRPVTGTYRLDDIDAVLESLCASHGLQVTYFTRYWATVSARAT